MSRDTTVIIGAGQAAAKCALQLRHIGYEGRVILLGDENQLPYQRPELSKSFLARPASASELVVLSAELALAQGIELHLDNPAQSVDLNERVVRCRDADFPFDKLVFASGGIARKLDDTWNLRTLSDARTLHAALDSGRHLTIIGGGWLGLEVAATARAHNLKVSLYEREERLCAKALPAELSDRLLDHHTKAGVKIHLGVDNLDAIPRTDVTCACIGIQPNDALAMAAGIQVERGIVVNERQMTTAPNVFAIGDCARESGTRAIENWAYANVSADRAAHAICDIAIPVRPDLWQWSKQGDLLLQMRGDYRTADQCVVQHGKVESNYFYLKDSKLVACISINDPVSFGQSRNLYRSQCELDPEQLSRRCLPLRSARVA